MDENAVYNLHRPADDLIRAMYEGRVGWAARERAQEQKRQAVFATVQGDDAASSALYRLVYGLQSRTALCTLDPVLARLGPQPGNTGWDALLHFARFHDHWRREPEDWQAAPDSTARDQIGTLSRHLFAEYALPAFFDAAWLSGFGTLPQSYREWFVHLGQGGKLEAIQFPLPLTHRAAHFFLLAPSEEFTFCAALRAGQIRALGGSDDLAAAVAETFLSEFQDDENFWYTVIQFFAAHPNLPLYQIGPLADYLRTRHRDDSGFTMKGRTLDAVLRQMGEWHETLNRLNKKTPSSWAGSGLSGWDERAKDPCGGGECHWRIIEITDGVSLLEEGRALRHCVRSYQDACVKGGTSIWSLRLGLSDNPAVRRLLTIEVSNTRRAIVQVRGKCNQSLGALRGNQRLLLARDVLRAWAVSQRLGIACAL